MSWRGIAREVGMNPASLYTYFESLDDLFTALIIDSYGGLAQSLTAAGEEAGVDPTERLAAYSRAYLRWAEAHPGRFNLIWTDQLPGYAAPPGGPTVDAEIAVIAPLVEAVGSVLEQPATVDALGEVPQELLDGYLAVWGTLHGLVSLLINSHLPVVEDRERLVVGQVLRAVEALRDLPTT